MTTDPRDPPEPQDEAPDTAPDTAPDPTPSTASGARVSVDCFVRASALDDAVSNRLAELRRLSREGAVDELVVRTWPDKVVLSDETDGHAAIETFRTFRRWATQWEVSVEPPFARETQTSKLTGETREVLRTPAICLTVTVNGRLEEVFPHRADGTTYTVADALAALEGRDRIVDNTTPESTPSRSAAAAEPRCPGCNGGLETGQGLYACRDCEWVGIASGTDELRRHAPAEETRVDRADQRTTLP